MEMDLAIVLGIVAVIVAFVFGVISMWYSRRQFRTTMTAMNGESKERERHELEEKARFAATSSVLEQIRNAVVGGRLIEVKLKEGIETGFDNLVRVAQDTHSGWSPSEMVNLGGRDRSRALSEFPELTQKAIEEGKKKDNEARSDKHPED